jgi:hypothetical protein
MRTGDKRLTFFDIERIKKLYAKGKSESYIGRYLNRNHATILWWLRKLGLKTSERNVSEMPKELLRKLSYFDRFIERNKENYIIKNKCCSCEKSFKNNWQHYKRCGNFCNDCIIRISKLPNMKGSEIKSFYKLLSTITK